MIMSSKMIMTIKMANRTITMMVEADCKPYLHDDPLVGYQHGLKGLDDVP